MTVDKRKPRPKSAEPLTPDEMHAFVGLHMCAALGGTVVLSQAQCQALIAALGSKMMRSKPEGGE